MKEPWRFSLFIVRVKKPHVFFLFHAGNHRVRSLCLFCRMPVSVAYPRLWFCCVTPVGMLRHTCGDAEPQLWVSNRLMGFGR